MTTTAPAVPRLFERFCDDAAVFPPGNLPLERAVPAHLEHVTSGYEPLVGPFVVAAAALPELARLLAGRPARSFEAAVTVSEPRAVAVALSAADGIPALRVTAVDAALASADQAEVERLLAERDPAAVTERVRAVGDRAARVREQSVPSAPAASSSRSRS